MRKTPETSKTKEKLLSCAQELMLAKGFAATSLEAICTKAKLTKGCFFHYFKSKEELGKAVLEHFCCSSRQKMKEGCCSKDRQDPLECVYGYVDFAIKLSRDPASKKGCLIGTFAQELSDTYPEIRSLCADGFSEWSEMIRTDLCKAKTKYAPKANFDCQSLAEYFIAVLEGSQILARAKRDTRIMEKNLRHFKHYLESLFERK